MLKLADIYGAPNKTKLYTHFFLTSYNFFFGGGGQPSVSPPLSTIFKQISCFYMYVGLFLS